MASPDKTPRLQQTCQNCGRKVGHELLTLARDPWDGKMKWVCLDADSCSEVKSVG